jgi:hypothetical protein
MKSTIRAAVLCWVVCSGANLWAQEKPKTEEKTESRRDVTPIRVQVILAEYDGEKKISSLPYTLLLNAERPRGGKASIRMGLRVPVVVSGAENGPKQFQYQDLGTNLDGWAGKTDDGGFDLHLAVERSLVYSPTLQKSMGVDGTAILSTQPVIQQFKTEFDAPMRDGQTLQSTLATDPVSGRVTKVEVTVNKVK